MAKYIYTQESEDGEISIICYKIGTMDYKWLSYSGVFDIGIGTWKDSVGAIWTKNTILNQYCDSIILLGEFDTLNNPVEVLYG